jgi:acyl-CoA synthetase (AMP-forming)/AMP-acid ligase II
MGRNLGDMLDGSRTPDKVVLIETEADGATTRKSYTAHVFDKLINAVARGLLKRGLRRGDAVGILSLNRAEFVAVYFGAMRAGMVAVPINWKLPTETLRYIAGDALVKLFFTDIERLPQVPDGVPAINFDGVDWTAFLDSGPFESITPRNDEIAQILYTSGSTGRPKGVPLSHAGQRWAVETLSTEDVSAHRLLVAAPLFHMNALFNCKFSFHNNATAVLMPLFLPRSYIAAIEAHGVTWLTSVPTMLAMVAREVGAAPPPASFHGVMRIYMGSSSFGQSLLERVHQLFPNAAISNAYGTTEAGPAVFGRHPDGIPAPDLSIGYPLAGVEVRIVDPEGRTIAGAGEGVLQMRTPALMKGYLNLPEQTARALRDGWYHTNDLVRRDADGFYFFVGRADDMFVSGGENIYPGEVEKLLERHAGVQQAVVVPVPDEIKQSLPFAFIVREPGEAGARTGEADIKQWALQNGPAYQHPRWVEFVSAMPLAGTNKIDRAALKERAKQVASGGRR